MTGVAATSGLARPGRGWVLGCLYPVVAVLVVLFVAFPIVDILVRALLDESAEHPGQWRRYDTAF